MDTNLKLYLPFDQMENSVSADFTPARHDATITGNSELTSDHAIKGQAIDLKGGTAVSTYDIPYSSDFSLTCWVRPTANRIGWLLNFSGLDNYIEQWLPVNQDEWSFLGFVRKGGSFTVYLNNNVVAQHSIESNPIGLSVNEPGLVESWGCLDDIRVYDKALSGSEIATIQNRNEDVEYYVDGVNFKEYGVHVSSSVGLVGQLERKEGLSVEWADFHGKVVDRTRPRFRERKITLDCFVEAASRTDFVLKVNSFFAKFCTSGSQRLKVEYDGTAKPLVYEVYVKDRIDPTKTWGTYNAQLMVGTFKLILEEDEPVKKVVRFVGSGNCTIGFTSNKKCNIYWGDGTHTYNLSGAVSQTHNFATAGEYDIIITGIIEDITNFSTNGIVIWNKLQ